MSGFTKFQIILVTLLLCVATFFGGFYLGKRGYEVEVKKNPPEIEIINKFPSDEEVDFALFWEIWQLLEDTYLERPVDSEQMFYGAIKGMVASLGDPYTSFLPPKVNESFDDALEGNYKGIGAELGLEDGQLFVIAPLEGSPAEAAGVEAGDKIIKIEEESTAGITLVEAVSKIRGEAGTFSSLTLLRNGGEPFIVKIKRGVVNVPSITWEDKGNGTAYIRLSRFGDHTNKEWSTTVSEVNSQMAELDVIILDVRGNAGGFLQAAVHISEEFFTNEPVLYQESATGKQTPFMAERVGAFENIPEVIILIDGGSASASEILAGALRANIRATLVGQNSFGKGTIQDSKDFEDGSGVHITIAKWLTPDKVWVHKEGLKPDIEVEQKEEDTANKVDTVLEVALELAENI
jgi:carboxyl-terminal processing protease